MIRNYKTGVVAFFSVVAVTVAGCAIEIEDEQLDVESATEALLAPTDEASDPATEEASQLAAACSTGKQVTCVRSSGACTFTDMPIPTTTRPLRFLSTCPAAATSIQDTVIGVMHTIQINGTFTAGQAFYLRVADKNRYYHYSVTVQ